KAHFRESATGRKVPGAAPDVPFRMLAFTSDGSRVVGVLPLDRGEVLTVRSVETGEQDELRLLEGEHTEDAVLSPDGRTLVTVGAGVRVWELPSGRLLTASADRTAGAPWVYGVGKGGRLEVEGDPHGEDWSLGAEIQVLPPAKEGEVRCAGRGAYYDRWDG